MAREVFFEFFILISSFLLVGVDLIQIRCPTTHAPQTREQKVESVFDFGEPRMIVTSFSQKLHPYSLIDEHRRTSILEEYLLVGYKEKEGYHKVYENLRMVMVDKVKNIITDAASLPDLIHQNLEKELYWEYFNSTGVYPSLMIINATRKTEIQFSVPHAEEESDIAFHAEITEKGFFNEPQPPYDAIFEIPGNSRVLRSEKTMIQYQSFSLWRWNLSTVQKKWSEIKDPSLKFHRIDNPCIKDMFLLCLYNPENNNSTSIYLASPLIQSHLQEHWFYDMYTPNHSWYNEQFVQMVLTNDHLVVLTNKSLWISQSINDSSVEGIDLKMEKTTGRPLLKFNSTNPCDIYEDRLHCFKTEHEDSNPRELKYKLYYSPICFLNQVPYYDDYLIFVVHDEKGDDDFSVMYAAKPYKHWKILFMDAYHYIHLEDGQNERYIINDIVGIIFNHHLRLFDITIEVRKADAAANSKPSYIRFALPEPNPTFDGYGNLIGSDSVFYIDGKTWRELNGFMGNGFIDKKFPDNFEVKNVVMNGDTHDIFFLGTQLWIAEAGGPFVYPAITGLTKTSETMCKTSPTNSNSNTTSTNTNSTNQPTSVFIQDCSFNHPDRIYVCVSSDQDVIFAGKIGAYYSPTPVAVDSIHELKEAAPIHGWSKNYICQNFRRSVVYVAGYSGKVLQWFLDDPEEIKTFLENAINEQDNSPCSEASNEPMLCEFLKRWRQNQCTVEAVGEPSFQMLALDPAKFTQRKESTAGPLVPFLIDSTSAILFEAKVPSDNDYLVGPAKSKNADKTHRLYFSRVHIGQKILCRNYELLKKDETDPYEKFSCELLLQHLKPVEGLLDGFRTALYVTVIKNIPLTPVPADIAVLVLAKSNEALIQVNDFLNEPRWTFTNEHIGQTLYLPGNFSILLIGFPETDVDRSRTIMAGYTTMYSEYDKRVVYNAFHSFLMDMSTQEFRQTQIKHQNYIVWYNEKRRNATDHRHEKLKRDTEEARLEIAKKFNAQLLPGQQHASPDGIPHIFKTNVRTLPKRKQVEYELLTVNETVEVHEKLRGIPRVNWAPPPAPPANDLVYGNVPYDKKQIWYLAEPECDYIMTMDEHPILNGRGGRISMDLHDRLTFTIRLRSTTPLGKINMHRPLLVMTNSNPDLLEVEKDEQLSKEPQILETMLLPTGFQKGVAVVSVRVLVSSLKCQQSTSLTLTVLLHREAGRRLHANYPVSSCKPKDHEGMSGRPWYTEEQGCITEEEILDPDTPEIVRYYQNIRHIIYIALPPNYRPPSFEGSDIPTSKNVYNVDLSKPYYKDWYNISKSTRILTRCEGTKSKEECQCDDNDRLSDDEFFTECKEKVFYTVRTGSQEPLEMSMSYDPLMRDSDQIQSLFTPKVNWSIIIEEVNGRTEWFISSPQDRYLRKINTDRTLNLGRKHYNMKDFKVSLLGTGLFHFKVTLGRFESFDEVTGHFILYANPTELHNIHSFIIMLATILFCLTVVFLRFLKSRKRLQAMLPVQPATPKRKLKLL